MHWRGYMETATGVLGWAPAVFWAATPPELRAAFDGWRRVNCIRRDDGALSDDEVARLEKMKRRFPDDAGARS